MNIKAVLTSLVIHMGLAALVLLNAPSQNFDKPDYIEVAFDRETLTENITRDTKTLKKLSLSNNMKQPNGKLRGSSQPIIFPQYKLGSLLSAVESRQTVAENEGLRFSFKDPKSYDTDISEIFGDNGNENWPLYKEIFVKVDSNLKFDSLLAQYNHFGRVYVQFQLDESGNLEDEKIKVESRDSILKVHVLRALKKSFNEPLNNFGNEGKGILYSARFDFNFGNFQQNFDKQKNFGRPVFVFSRFTEEKPVPEELLEQLLTGGASPNISLMYERWQKYNQKKRRKAVEFDPFESYRRDRFYNL